MYSTNPPIPSDVDNLNEIEAPTFIPVENLPLPQPMQQKRSRAGIVAMIEIAYRLFLLLRTAYFCLTFNANDGYGSRNSRRSPGLELFYVQEIIRMGPGLSVWVILILMVQGSYHGDGEYRQFAMFIIPYLLYSAGLIFVSFQLKTATSEEEPTLSVVKRWICVHTSLFVGDVIWYLLVFFYLMSWAQEIVGQEIILACLGDLYRGATLKYVNSFKDELEPRPRLGLGQGVPLQQGMMLMVMNPGVGVGQLPVVRPQAYQMGNQNPQMATYAYPQQQQQFPNYQTINMMHQQQQQQQTRNMIALQDDHFF